MGIQNKVKEMLVYFKNIYHLYKKIWGQDKSYVINSILIIFVKALYPFNRILFLKLIIDELAGNLRWTSALIYVISMCTIELILRSFDSIFWTYEQKKILRFKSIFLKELSMKTMDLSYEQIDNPYLHDHKQKAMAIFYPGQAQFMDLKNTLIDSKQLVAYVLQLIGVIIIFLTITPYVFLVLFIIYLISIVLNIIAADKEFNVWSHSLVNIGRRVGYYQELATDFTYAKEMRTNILGQWVVDKMYYYFDTMKSGVNKAVNVFTIMNIISNTLQITLNGAVYFYIAWLAYTGFIPLSDVIVYINSLGVFVTVLAGISTCLISLQKAGMHLSTYFKYLTTVSHTKSIEDNANIVLDTTTFTVEFINVYFKYPEQDHYAIKNLNLTIYPNEKIAIVGENGAGKTTFIKLLLRFYKPTKGQILINGIDIQNISMDNYMKNITAVFQDFNILNYPLIENFVFDHAYEENTIKEIIHNLNLEKTVNHLPNGLYTELGRLFDHKGIELSGGQKQKLAIARALFKNSPFVILDEPTAMLSPQAEYEIYTNFAKLTQDKTTVYISHRMSSCRFCDRIIVMELGEIVESGNHEELIKKEGEYYKLYNIQAEFYKTLDD
ncbi:ABC transporter ATP-binding protein [Paenibacillus nicotianae]|uniref:ABC transporter ATP-binding protein n=1 Tax=Paenibacillus nicotianae TaxID=1526551 RepID=A0ABW4URF2_9BACL